MWMKVSLLSQERPLKGHSWYLHDAPGCWDKGWFRLLIPAKHVLALGLRTRCWNELPIPASGSSFRDLPWFKAIVPVNIFILFTPGWIWTADWCELWDIFSTEQIQSRSQSVLFHKHFLFFWVMRGSIKWPWGKTQYYHQWHYWYAIVWSQCFYFMTMEGK